VKLTVRDLQHVPHTQFLNAGALSGMTMRGVSTDSRTTAPGDLFIALRGEHFDGHAFLRGAFARGAVAAVVDSAYDPGRDVSEPMLVVDDTTNALNALARRYRDKHKAAVLVVGGSNGKTTTKDMIARVLETRYRVLRTEGNFNNHVGVPRTLFRLTPRHEVAVIEIGTNHPGEIARLCATAGPTHGLLTNIGSEHLEFFGSLEGVAREEGEMFAALRATRGATGIVNANDHRVSAAARGLKKSVTYGFAARSADVRGRRLTLDVAGHAQFEFSTPRSPRWHTLRLQVPGAHTAVNALAAIAAGYAFSVPAAQMQQALESFHAPGKRMEVANLDGVTVLNDSYNANPDSMRAALQTLASMRGAGKRIAVLGDMKELGNHADEAHTAIGREAAALGLDYLLTYGTLARRIHDAAYGPGSIHYDQKNILAEFLAELVSPGDIVLVKGSRSMEMEDIVIFLEERRGRVPAA
jgi:UDP-N-acetylmuramoyl-tripeptide--D-alanyl-D-alanine ligase